MVSPMYPILESLVCFSAASKRELPALRLRSSNPLAYLKEHCTIRCSCARQSGHSFAVRHAAQRLFHRTLVLTPTFSIARRFLEVTKGFDSTLLTNDRLVCCSLHEATVSQSVSYVGFDAIVVDPSYGMTAGKIDDVYSIALANLLGSDDEALDVSVVFMG